MYNTVNMFFMVVDTHSVSSFHFLCVISVSVQYSALEAKLCQVESKYLVLLQDLKAPVCSAYEQGPSGEVISRLLEDALQVEMSDQQEHTILKPHPVRYGCFCVHTCLVLSGMLK